MAGLFDRLTSDDNVQIHMLVAGIRGYGAGIWSRAQVLSAVNGLLASPLSASEEADYEAIANAMDAEIGATNKLVYANVVEAVMIAAEAGVIDDAAWRTALGIS